MDSIYLIAALGNPGREYANTRHNVGFMAADAFCDRNGINQMSERFSSLLGKCSLGAHRVIVIKPQTYMNDSGIAVAQAANFYKIPPENIIVIHDDVEFPLGVIKIRSSGGSGTHNGMKSVVACLNSKNFPRLKFGVGDERGGKDLKDFVLSPFLPEEMETVRLGAQKAAEIIECIILEGIDTAMNKHNPRKVKETKDKSQQVKGEEDNNISVLLSEDRINEQRKSDQTEIL